MKIAVLYIALGRYSVFWKEFYETAEQFLLPEDEKTYFVFTDNEEIPFETASNVQKIAQPKLGWPYDSLMRFDMFLGIEQTLSTYDYAIFFNANLAFRNTVGREILPAASQDGLVTGSHEFYYNKQANEFPYERNPQSTAYIPYGSGHHYARGTLIGGQSEAFLTMCRVLSHNIKMDNDRKIMAVWHDESHINKYLVDKNPLILPVNYLYPTEEWMEDKSWYQNNPFKADVKIECVNKNDPKYGGLAYLRGDDLKPFSLKKKCFYLLSKVAPLKPWRKKLRKRAR